LSAELVPVRRGGEVMPPPDGEWLSRIMLPLVQGGDVHIDSARRAIDVDLADLGDFATDLLVARQARLAAFSTRPLGLPFDETTHRLCRAIGNLLATTHPSIGKRVRDKIVKEVDQDLAVLEPPADADEHFRRLTLTWRLCSLARRDVTVRYWAGERRFLGQVVPKRLLAWQTVRRVHQESNDTLVAYTLMEHEGFRPFLRILELAPLCVAYEPLLVPAESLFDQLRHVVIASRPMRFVLARFSMLGLPKCLARLATVLHARLGRKTFTKRDLTTVRFFAHALITWALGEPADKVEPLRAAYELQFAAAGAEGLWQIAAGFSAAYRCGVGAPFDLSGPAAEKVKILYEATSAYAGEPRCKALVAPLREVIG
jgi:hypothetical protein